MWLLDKMLRAMVKDGQLRVIDHDGSEHRYGDLSAEPVTIRFTDKGAALHVARDPRVGAGEAYMDGRLLVEPPHDIRDMVLLVMANANRGRGQIAAPNPLKRGVDWIFAKADQINLRPKASSNVTHHYDLTDPPVL
jgi:cyclopropane-fatty-acyl-phospholipid synthase